MQYDHAYAYTPRTDEAHNTRRRPRHDAYTYDERYARDSDADVSGSWRDEYAAQGVDPDAHEHQLATDGGGGGGGDGGDRPGDCICWDDTNDLPCFACRRDGFTDPNPAEPEADTDVEAYPATIGAEADSTDSDTESDHAVATDGGATTTTSTFDVPEPGDIVHDRESTHGDDRLLVLSVREETDAGSEYIKEIGATVDDVNPEYSPHAPVARCVYCEEVEDVDPEASMDDVRAAAELDVFNCYSFPVDRLALGDVDAAGGEER